MALGDFGQQQKTMVSSRAPVINRGITISICLLVNSNDR